ISHLKILDYPKIEDLNGSFRLYSVSCSFQLGSRDDLHSAFGLYSSNGYTTSLCDVVLSLRSVGCIATLDDIKEHYPGGSVDFPTFLRLFYGMKSTISEISLKPILDFVVTSFDNNKDQLMRVLRRFGDAITTDCGDGFIESVLSKCAAPLFESALN
ncbi:hypothetical protein FGIG_06480, partial [Fasciola gigantica]